MTSDESDKASAPLHGNASCAGLSPRSDGMSPSANLSLEIQLGSCDTCSNSNRNIIALPYWRELSVIEWQLSNPPNILLGKNGVTEKNGNRSEYIKWCGVCTGLEPIVPPAPLKLGISSGERTHVCGLGDYEKDEKWNVHKAMCAHRLLFSVIVFGCHIGSEFRMFHITSSIN